MTGTPGLTFVSHGPAGSGPALMMRALAAGLRDARPGIDLDVVELPADEGAEAIQYLGSRSGDGTVLGSCTPTYLTTPLKQHLPWTSADFTAIAGLVTDTYLLAVRADRQNLTLTGLLKEKTVVVAAPRGGNTHIQAMLVGDSGREVEISFAPSVAAAIDAVAAGDADWTTGVGSDFAPGVAAGRLRIIGSLAAAGTQERPALIDVGIDVQFPLWRGVVAPPQLTRSQVDHWSRLLDAARATSPWRDYVLASGMQDAAWDAAGFRQVLDEEQPRYAGWIHRLQH